MQNKNITDFKSTNEAAEYFSSHQLKLAALILQQKNVSIYPLIEILTFEFKGISQIAKIKAKSWETMSNYADNAQKDI